MPNEDMPNVNTHTKHNQEYIYLCIQIRYYPTLTVSANCIEVLRTDSHNRWTDKSNTTTNTHVDHQVEMDVICTS